jgi:sphinganine C4-monooxygenase
MWFFTMSTIKTVDDHCGYAFPWDPLQHLTSNNAGYHDIHHQSWGIKTNFSQPFFTFWDGLLGTKWTGGDVSARYERAKLAAQKKLDAENDANGTTTPVAGPYEKEISHASPTAHAAQSVAEPKIPAGKATYQAIGSRQQVLDDLTGGGASVIVEESVEEVESQRSLRSSLRKRGTSSGLGLKEFAGRVGVSLQGKGTGVLGVESHSSR